MNTQIVLGDRYISKSSDLIYKVLAVLEENILIKVACGIPGKEYLIKKADFLEMFTRITKVN
jgi:hypothetical protein